MPQEVLTRRWAREGRALLVCLSFFNAALIPSWAMFRLEYLESQPYPALFAAMLMLGLGLYLVAAVLRRHWGSRPLQALALLAFIALPLQGIGRGFGLGDLGVGALTACALLLSVVIVAMRRSEAALAVCVGLLLALSPLIAFSGYLAVAGNGPYPAPYAHYEHPQEAVAPAASAARPRIILVVLDEADYLQIYEHRPAALRLPAFDALARTSAFFTRALAPAPRTDRALPALLLGSDVEGLAPAGQHLGVRTAAGDELPNWLRADTLLTSMPARGMRTALVGYYHAYCSDGELRLGYCSHWRVFQHRRWAYDLMPFLVAAFQENLLLRPVVRPVLPLAAAEARRFHQAAFAEMTAEVMQVADRYDFIVAHLNYPHPAAVPIAAAAARLVKVTRAEYGDNLLAVDALLQRLVGRMARPGADRSTVLIVTSDHGLRVEEWSSWGYDVSEFRMPEAGRTDDTHVPLIVHFAGAPSPVRYEAAVKTVHLRSLIESIASGAVRDEHGVAAFFDSRRAQESTETGS